MLHTILAGIQESGLLDPVIRICPKRVLLRYDDLEPTAYYPQWWFIGWHNYYHEIGYGMIGMEHFQSMDAAVSYIQMVSENLDIKPKLVIDRPE